MRHPSRSLVASTHLVLKEASGEKYESALKWGIPAVKDAWLFASAKAHCIAPVDGYLVKPAEMGGNPANRVSTGENCIGLGQEPVQKSTSENPIKPVGPTGSIAAKPVQHLETSKPVVPPSEPFKQVLVGDPGGPALETPLKNFRPHFDIKVLLINVP